MSLPGVGGTAHRGQMVFVVKTETWVIQNRLSTPNNLPATPLASYSFITGKTQPAWIL